jgi:protein TonB
MTEVIKLNNRKAVYGAFELKRLYPRNYSIGLIIAVIIHLILIGSYYFIQSISKEDYDNIPTVRVMKYSDLGPPPSITNDVPQTIAVQGPVIKPTVGIPVPVPDKKVAPEQTIATQQELSQIQSPIIEQGEGNKVQITQDIKIQSDEDKEPDINAFIPVEKMPEIVYSVRPDYPDAAKRADIEGTVYVKMLVDKEGKVLKAVVIKSEADILNQPAIDAAMKFVFTPAIQNKKPISVWIVVPFKFQLNGPEQ